MHISLTGLNQCSPEQDNHPLFVRQMISQQSQTGLELGRFSRNVHFGLKFWLSTSAGLALLFPLSAHFEVVRFQRQIYFMIALVATLQERADATLTRSVLRLAFAAIAGTLGEC